MKCTLYLKFEGQPLRTKRELRYTYVVYSSKAETCTESLDWMSIRNTTMRYLRIEPAIKGYSHFFLVGGFVLHYYSFFS